MKVIEVYETNLPGNRTALKTDAEYTPYVICTNYNPEAKEGSQWDSAYGYYTTFTGMCKGVTEITMDKEPILELQEYCREMIRMNTAYGEDTSDWERRLKVIGG